MGTCVNHCRRSLAFLLYAAGLALSGFAYYVKHRKDSDPDYRAPCDVQEGMMCSDVMKTEYSKGFGLVGKVTGDEDHPLNASNSLYGLVMYSVLALVLAVGPNSRFLVGFQFYCMVGANLLSVYLFYILYFVLKNVCIICYTLYAVNFLLLIDLYFIRKNVSSTGAGASSSRGRLSDRRGQPSLLPSSADFKKHI